MISNKLISKLCALFMKAKATPRLRCNLDLRNSAYDQLQGILNAMETVTEIPIHRHQEEDETVVGSVAYHQKP